MTSATIDRIRTTLRQFLKFGIVGGAGVVVNMIATVIINKLNGGPENAQAILFPIPGTRFNVRFTVLVWVLAFLVANLFNFLLNRHWTFRHGQKAPFWREFWPFLVVGSIAAVLGLVLKVGFTHPLSPIFLSWQQLDGSSGLRSREYWAQLLAIVFTMPINFIVNKLWTFRAVRRRHADRVGVED